MSNHGDNAVEFVTVLTKGAEVTNLTGDGKKNYELLQKQWARREEIMAKLYKLNDSIGAFIEQEISRHTLEAKMSMLDKYMDQLTNNQAAIYDNPLNSEVDEEENEVMYKTYQRRLIQLSAAVLDEYKDTKDTKPNISMIKVKLPEQKVPEFNGDLLSWKRFKETFESLIHSNNQIPSVQKFHYLLSALKNGTDSIIKEIPISSDNYDIAWNVLQDRYDNQNALIDAHLEKLFSLKAVSKDNLVELRSLVDTVQSNVRALEALKVPVEHWSAILIYIMKQKLDVESQKQWQLQLQPKEIPEFDKMITFLNNRCRMLESIQQRQKPSKEESKSSSITKTVHKSKTSSSFSTEAKSLQCQLCKDSHHLYHCPKFLDMTPQDRKDKVKSLKSCFKCLGPHTRECTTKKSCKKCGNSNHNTLLHLDFNSSHSDSKDPEKKEDSEKKEKQESNFSIQVRSNKSKQKPVQTLMATALVLVANSIGNWQIGRALLDSASNSSFITEDFAQRLNLTRQKTCIPVSGIDEIKTSVKWQVYATFKSRVSQFQDRSQFLIVSRISNRTPAVEIDIDSWKIPQQLELADPSFHKSAKVDLLIGTQHFYDVLKSGRITLGANKPSMFESEFGWIIAGSISLPKQVQSNSFFMDSVNQQKFVTRNWLEDKQLTEEDIKCENHFKLTTKRDSSGRYIVALPLKSDAKLGDSKSTAMKCLLRLQNQFEINSELEYQYRAFIDEYLQLGHMEEVPENEWDAPNCYYIPHHPVIKMSSSTTKLRVVFNASCKTSNQRSLNDVLMTGPNIQNDLRTLLINFMIHNYVFVADIEKMFRQIKVHRRFWDLLRILWIVNKKVKVFRLTTVTYGTICAPYQAVRILKQASEDYTGKYPKGSKAVKKDMYMDNELTGADDIDDLIEIQQEVIKLLAETGMKLRKFAANHPKLLVNISSEDLEPLVEINHQDSGISTLGLMWNPSLDRFIFKVPELQDDSSWTKRSILSELHKLFDPMGWVSPISIIGSLLMQKIWSENKDWDAAVSVEIQSQWKEFHNQWPLLQNIQKDRLVVPHKHRIELQGFADASQKAYGAVIYIRCFNSIGDVAVNMLCSQSRVAPQVNKKRKNPVTLPKLELNAALLLSRLAHKVSSTIELQFDAINLWSDSTITLAWIKEDSDKYIPYVARRVKEIQELTQSMSWKHVSSKDNPADIVSRGMLPSQLINSELWWKGPSFLQSNEYQAAAEVESELDSAECYLLDVNNHQNQFESLIHIEKFSSYKVPVRRMAWLLRFIHNCRHKKLAQEKQIGPLTYSEFSEAERKLVRQIQQECYTKEFKTLLNKKPIDSKSQLLSLNPTIKNGVIVVGGRLRNSLLSESQKYPMILPKDHHFTKLLIESIHKQTLHGGPQLVLATIRHKFWIIQGKQQVKKVIRKCLQCFRAKPKFIDQVMGDLPAERIQPNRPFAVTGIDYCGYFHVQLKTTRSMTLMKVWVCVFVCYATKAIHLEPVTDLTTEAFRSCLIRFRARRGKCTIINSDNQSTFHGAKNQIDKEIHQFLSDPEVNQEVKDLCTQDGMEWRFIPPRCPHVGGLWESGVKSFKHHFKRIVGESHLTMESFFTLVYEIESCLNSRPLMALSEDTEDYTVLTPGHFLIGESLNSPVEPDVTSIPFNRLNQYQRRLKMQQQFWKVWSRDYLNTLQQKNKWRIEKQHVKEGDIVLVIEDNVPATKWPMARVIKTIIGTDGKIRMVDLKTKAKDRIIRRSVHRICPLPTNEVE